MPNFNLLQAIQPGSVMGSLPVVAPQSSGAEDFTRNFLGSALQAGQLQTQGMQRQLMGQQYEANKQAAADQQTAREGLQGLENSDDPFTQIVKVKAKLGDAEGAMTAIQTKQAVAESLNKISIANAEEGRKAIVFAGQMSVGALQLLKSQPQAFQKWYNEVGHKELVRVDSNMPKPGSPLEEIDAHITGVVGAAMSSQLAAAAPQTLANIVPGVPAQDTTGSPKTGLATEINNAASQKNSSTAQKDDQTIVDLSQKPNLNPGEKILLKNAKDRQAARARGMVNPDNMIQKGLAELDIKEVTKAAEDAALSQEALNDIEVFKELNKKFKTGIFGGTKLAIQQGYEQLTGNKLEGTKSGEALQATGMNFIMKRIQNTKGAISDNEMKSFAKSSPGMTNSKEGNAIILDTYEKVEKRKIEMAESKRSYLEEHGNLKGWKEEWNNYIKANPIITPETFNVGNTKSYTRNGAPFDMEAAKKATGLSEEEIIKKAGLK